MVFRLDFKEFSWLLLIIFSTESFSDHCEFVFFVDAYMMKKIMQFPVFFLFSLFKVYGCSFQKCASSIASRFILSHLLLIGFVSVVSFFVYESRVFSQQFSG